MICVFVFSINENHGLDWFRCGSYLANKQACKSARMQECSIDITIIRHRTTSFEEKKNL